MSVKSDIEIAREAKMKPIMEIGKRLGIPEKDLIPYGHTKAKVHLDYVDSLKSKPDGKLILVTAINPTPAGEGKTTTTVGLGDGLNRIGKKAMVALREPSLGPCFGMKGGAAGGGYAQIVPMEDINLHFTGDFHAITSAHNLPERPDRQPHLLGQRTRHRHPPRGLAPRDGHERPRAARDRLLARRCRQRLSARSRLRHHGRFRDHGHPLPRRPRLPTSSAASARSSSPTRRTRPRFWPRTSRRRAPWSFS